MKSDALRAELAHLGRVRMIDPLSGSFAHEINQPLTAVMANAEAALRLLEIHPTPVLALRETLDEILKDNKRAGDVMQRMRALLKKGTALSESVDVNGVVSDVLKLVQGNAALRRVLVEAELAAGAVDDAASTATELLATARRVESRVLVAEAALAQGWVDMARRAVHNEAAEMLLERLEGKVETDFATARRLFTLICVLHIRG